MAPLNDALHYMLFDPDLKPLLGLLKGARNGLVYGAKVRFPHSLIMALLFSSAPWPKRLSTILKGTRIHASNLAKFVVIYKALCWAQSRGSKAAGAATTVAAGGKMDPFWAGLVGGWVVFGDRTPVSEQIVLYVLSRVLTALLPREPLPAGATHQHQPIEKRTFAVMAALVWGSVMYMFRHHRERLAGGMASSMQYLYLDSETRLQQTSPESGSDLESSGESWSSWRTLLLQNK